MNTQEALQIVKQHCDSLENGNNSHANYSPDCLVEALRIATKALDERIITQKCAGLHE